MRAGDTVKHGPTGETWIVAAVEGDRLCWAGWPAGYADIADCTLVEACDDEAHWAMVRECAAMRPGPPSYYDARKAISERLLASNVDASLTLEGE